jgi:hypothetical protein
LLEKSGGISRHGGGSAAPAFEVRAIRLTRLAAFSKAGNVQVRDLATDIRRAEHAPCLPPGPDVSPRHASS